MAKDTDPKTLANYLNCLSVLETDAYQLYKNLADKTEAPLIKSMLLHLAFDSQKHSAALKGVAESIAKPGRSQGCEKKLGEAWRIIEEMHKEIDKKEKISGADLPQLSEKLVVLEGLLGEEYYMFVQLKTLELMVKEINQLYTVDLSSFRSIFTRIIQDEETHRVILQKIRVFIKSKEKPDNTPLVKFQNPDSWNRPLPPTS